MDRELFVYLVPEQLQTTYVHIVWKNKKIAAGGCCWDYGRFVQHLAHLKNFFDFTPAPLTPLLFSIMPEPGRRNFTAEEIGKLEKDIAAYKTKPV